MPALSLLSLIVVDAIPLFRQGLCLALGKQPASILLGEGASGAELKGLLLTHHPNVAIVDVQLLYALTDSRHAPLMTRRAPENSFHLLADLPTLQRCCPTTHFLLLIEDSAPLLLNLIARTGVHGCFTRADASAQTLAQALHIAESTLHNHLAQTYKRLGVSNLTAALLVAIHRGWLPPDPGVLV